MARPKGTNGEELQTREREDNANFALKRAVQDLELVELRIKQALRRGGPKELLEPAVDLIDETISRISRVNA